MQFLNHDYYSRKGDIEQACVEFPMMCWKYMRFKKASKGFICCVCHVECKPGMHYIGDNWQRTCMKCSPCYMKNTIKGFQKWIQHIKDNIKIQEENNSKWIKEAMAGALAYTKK